ncbi:hypothetical protein CEXT_327901 [Caerostris extrusa]|uniref:Uncharacterized protein n=1 Tax=Caerostris extrusa TaxID=172846 RepID=A0AAV4VBI1_CAEEX|nr:hypothetical protein CEXT_327901 [Caerostris extrusa]
MQLRSAQVYSGRLRCTKTQSTHTVTMQFDRCERTMQLRSEDTVYPLPSERLRCTMQLRAEDTVYPSERLRCTMQLRSEDSIPHSLPRQ